MAAPKKAQSDAPDTPDTPEGYDPDAQDNTYEVTPSNPQMIGEGGEYQVMESRLEGQTWGPYADYRIVDTAVGQFAVPAHSIMRIEWVKKFDPKRGEWKEQPKARYTPVQTDDPRTKPHTELTQEEIKRIKEHREARAKRHIA